MEVYECMAWGITPEKVISDNLVRFIEGRIVMQLQFNVKLVPQGTDPARITKGVIGYNPSDGIPYLSNPAREVGLTGIDIMARRLFYSAVESAFFGYDSVKYWTPEHRYVREGYEGVLRYFLDKEGFMIFAYVPRRAGDYLKRHKDFSEVQIGAQLQIADLL